MKRPYIDAGSTITIALTFVLFVISLFAHGLTHDLLLEAGVFLVSVKLILMSAKAAVVAHSIEDGLQEIRSHLARLEGASQ